MRVLLVEGMKPKAIYRKIRQDMNLVQKEFSDISGISQGNLSKYENGLSEPGASVISQYMVAMKKKKVVNRKDVLLQIIASYEQYESRASSLRA